MENRTKRDLALINLVSSFEAKIEQGDIEYINEKTLHQLVDYYEEEHQLDKALEVIQIALSQYQYRSDFYILKARILLRKGDLDLCFETLDEAEVIAPMENEIIILRARAESIRGNYEDSLEMLAGIKMVTLTSELSEVLICESYIYEEMKDYEMMYEVLKESLHINPKNEEALERMLLCTELSRKYEDSIQFLENLLDIEPYSYLAWYNLGHAYSYQGEYEKAIEAMEFSFIINKEFEAGYLDCAELCFQQRKFQKAYNIFEDCNEIFGPDSDLISSMANCLFHMGKISKAKYLLSKAIKVDPYNDEAYFLLGQCYAQESKWYSAINVFHKAVNIDDRCEQYFFELAKAYVKVEDYTKATFNFNKATRIGPEQANYWSEYVTFLLKLGLYQEALAILDEADEYTFGVELLYCRAIAHFHTQNRQQALVCLEEALTEDYHSHGILFMVSPELAVDNDVVAMIKYFGSELEE